MPYQKRWLLLLAASCYFYMAFVPLYILILGFTIVVDYFAGIYIENAQPGRRKLFLIVSLISNIGVLAVFKYYNFLNENLSFLLRGFALDNPVPHLSILLPVGLSFHTFQAMSYIIEVYRGHQKAERHFGMYALYVMFYPQLVAGPIERPQNLLHQFREPHDFEYGRVTSGLRLMAWGLFKKVVIADRLAVVVDTVYNSPQQHNSIDLIVATIFFSFQIFCDFSGYSDIAIGIARVMGIKLMTNFNRPYESRTISEFWRRWHISLSSWFRDYVYISLGGNRVSVPRWYLNLFVVFVLSGLWHGANWTFIIWGALHGFYLVFGLMTQNIRTSFSKFLKLEKLRFLPVGTTFTLVAFAWIFFRADSVQAALYISTHIFTGLPEAIESVLNHRYSTTGLSSSREELALCVLLIIFLEIVHSIQRNVNIEQKFVQCPTYIRWTAYSLFVFAILAFGLFQDRQFIYFQF